jgi:hypothetical protein
MDFLNVIYVFNISIVNVKNIKLLYDIIIYAFLLYLTENISRFLYLLLFRN